MCSELAIVCVSPHVSASLLLVKLPEQFTTPVAQDADGERGEVNSSGDGPRPAISEAEL